MPCVLPGNDIFLLGRGLLFCLWLRTPLQSDFSAWWQCLSVFDDLSDGRLNYGPRNPFLIGGVFLFVTLLRGVLCFWVFGIEFCIGIV